MKGAIIGDIVGSIYEFHNIKTKDFPLLSPNCFFTDDTVMTVAVAAALETAGVDAPDAVISRWMLEEPILIAATVACSAVGWRRGTPGPITAAETAPRCGYLP